MVVPFLSTSFGFDLYLVFVINCNGGLKCVRYVVVQIRYDFWKKRNVDTHSTGQTQNKGSVERNQGDPACGGSHCAVMAAVTCLLMMSMSSEQLLASAGGVLVMLVP